jgi:hypothetical protein
MGTLSPRPSSELPGDTREKNMSDLMFIAVAIGFFALSVAYAHGCERLRGGDRG